MEIQQIIKELELLIEEDDYYYPHKLVDDIKDLIDKIKQNNGNK